MRFWGIGLVGLLATALPPVVAGVLRSENSWM